VAAWEGWWGWWGCGDY